jgi:hypothetical protein
MLSLKLLFIAEEQNKGYHHQDDDHRHPSAR